MRKNLLLLTVGALVCSVLTGCGSSSANDSAKNEPQPKAGQFEGADDKADTSAGVSAKGNSESTASEQ